MISLKINPEEIVDIFRENVSGAYASENGLSGDGIGMFITKKLVRLNKGDIILHINVKPQLAKTLEGLPYENNVIEIVLKK
ncbi:MAG: hypothetical protein EOO46_16790 [Flavobacterium sp.]|nr:MAG: hypothetical protein EOO46_16790 [Flavobacterium sp.]